MTLRDSRTIRIGHSPDPDDAFMFHAMTTGRFDTTPYLYEHALLDIETLNQKALDCEFEVQAVSVHMLLMFWKLCSHELWLDKWP